MNAKRPVIAILLICVFACAPARAGILQILGSNTPYGIDGHNVVGVKGTGVSFVYDDITHTYTTLPLLDGRPTSALDISGTTIVGGYYDSLGNRNGLLYDLSTVTYTTLVAPSAGQGSQKGTTPRGIDGDNVVGSYVDAAGKQHGFLYDLDTQVWTKLDYPGAFSTSLADISGNYIVGEYSSSSSGPVHALIYDRMASTWSTIGGPGFEAFGIDGNKVVGGSIGWGFASGWLYNLDTSQFINPLAGVPAPPGQLVTGYRALGISHTTIVGQYHYQTGSFSADSGFVYIGIPEMGTFALVGFSAAGLAILLGRRVCWRDSSNSRRV